MSIRSLLEKNVTTDNFSKFCNEASTHLRSGRLTSEQLEALKAKINRVAVMLNEQQKDIYSLQALCIQKIAKEDLPLPASSPDSSLERNSVHVAVEFAYYAPLVIAVSFVYFNFVG